MWYSIVRPIAVGGMLVGAGFTLFRMRKQLMAGMKRAVSDLKKSAEAHKATSRVDRDLNAKVVFAGVGLASHRDDRPVLLFHRRCAQLEHKQGCARVVVAAAVMIVLGFFLRRFPATWFGMIGSSNNPVSGLTLCTLVVAARWWRWESRA